MKSMLLSQVLCFESSTEDSVLLDIHVSYAIISLRPLLQYPFRSKAFPENPPCSTSLPALHPNLYSPHPLLFFLTAHVAICQWQMIYLWVYLFIVYLSVIDARHQDGRDIVSLAFIPQCQECGNN